MAAALEAWAVAVGTNVELEELVVETPPINELLNNKRFGLMSEVSNFG